MRVVQSNPDWNLVTVCVTIVTIAGMYAFLIYKGKL